MPTTIQITEPIARKVLTTVNAGLSAGLGTPAPGEMCVEAAVCYALGLPHGDDPACVAPTLRHFKIRLNDAEWSSNAARAAGLRRLALIQLGSAGHLDEHRFVTQMADLAVRRAVPYALRAAAHIQKDPHHKAALLEHAGVCEREGTQQAALGAKKAASAASAASAAYAAYAAYTASAYAAYTAAASAASAAYAAYTAASAAAAYAAYAASAAAYASAARDKFLADFAEQAVQVLITLKVPGAQWLNLAPLAE